MTSSRRGAHSGFMRNGYCVTDSDTSCARVQLLRANGVERPIDKASRDRFQIGFNNENDFCNNLEQQRIPYLANVEAIKGRFTGHADVVVGDTVYELKSVTSANVWRNVLQGKYKLSNLAQLIGYMWALDKQHGKLVYTLYVDSARSGEVEFSVRLSDSGVITMDGVIIEFTLQDWLDHHRYLLNEMDNRYLHPDRPTNPGDVWSTPCSWCFWNPVCDRFNVFKDTAEEFISKCTTHLANKGVNND